MIRKLNPMIIRSP